MSVKIIAITALMAALLAPYAFAEEINPVVGKTVDFTLRETDLDRLIASQPPEARRQFQEKPELKVTLVQELLVKMAIASKARKEAFDKSPEFREQLAYVVNDFISREYLSKVVVAAVKVPEEELKKFYQDNKKDFLIPETIKARHIFIQVTAAATADERAKKRAKVDDLLQQLHKGAAFAKLALEASEDADTAKKGGELGVISPGKTNSSEFEKAAFALKAGEISTVVETPYGYHIIKVDEKSPQRTATFEESRPVIADRLQQEYEQKKAQEFIEKTAKENGLEVYADRITGVKQEGDSNPLISPAKKAD